MVYLQNMRCRKGNWLGVAGVLHYSVTNLTFDFTVVTLTFKRLSRLGKRMVYEAES